MFDLAPRASRFGLCRFIFLLGVHKVFDEILAKINVFNIYAPSRCLQLCN